MPIIAVATLCYILFATYIVRYELTAVTGIEQATRFLGQSFRGGSDVAACMSALLDKLEDDVWHDADAVMISDFIAQHLPEEIVQCIRQRPQQHHHLFHAVAILQHAKPGILHIFDHIWQVDTGLKGRLLRRLRHA